MTEISNLPAVTIPFSGTELFPVTQNQVTKKSLLTDLTGYFSTPGILPFLPLAGGTMLGPLFLARDPIGVMEAVTKQYVDARLFPEAPNNLYTYGRLGPTSNSWNPVLPLTGGTLTGGLSVPDLGVTNNVSIGGSVGVGGGITVTGSVSVGQNIGVGGRIDAGAVYGGYVQSSGSIYAVGDLTVGGNASISGALGVGNGITTNNVHATNNITADGSINTAALFTTNLTTYGTINAGSLGVTDLSATNLSVSGGITAGGQIFGNTIVGNGITSFGDILAYGNVSGVGLYGNYIHSNGNIDAGGAFNGASLAISGIGSFGNYITAKAVFAAETLNSAGNVNTVTYQIQGTPFAFSGANGAGSFTTVCDSTGFPAIDMYGSNGTYYRTDNAHFFTNRAATFNICHFQSGDGNTINISGSWNIVSDKRVKRELEPYKAGLAELKRLNPVSYRYTDDAPFNDGQIHHGLVAQDVEEVLPEMVRNARLPRHGSDEMTDYLTMAPGHLVFVLVNAVKELAERLTALEKPA